MVSFAQWLLRGARQIVRTRFAALLLLCLLAVAWQRGIAQTPSVPPEPPPQQKFAVAVAQTQAELLHQTLTATLSVIHRSYFKGGETLPVPSRALEGVFYRLKRNAQIEARWMAVNTPAMSLEHKPRNAFEKRAATALARGQRTFVQVDQRYLRRAGAITLFSSCLKCHSPAAPGKKRNPVAALVISVPLSEFRREPVQR
ncbi:MAG: DUF3365 domain-containing protein [Planctomycetota bacterium]|nr:DUF3365 domain-containing protein [Planctomycetota bacterium]